MTQPPSDPPTGPSADPSGPPPVPPTGPPTGPPPAGPEYAAAPYQPPSKPSGMSPVLTRVLRIALSVGVVLAIGAGVRAFQDSQDDADRDSDGQLKSEQEVSAFEVQKGDCIDDEALSKIGVIGQEVDEVKAIPCDKPHTLEAYHVFDLPDGDYPGTTETEKLADAGCVEAFAPFVGLPFNKSKLIFYYLYPQAASWSANDDRSVTCLIGEADGSPTTGTLEGAKR